MFTFIWHRIYSAVCPGTTPDDSSKGDKNALEKTVSPECLNGILRAGGPKSTARSKKRADKTLVTLD